MKSNTDFNSKIITWLDEQGYPLEMRTAATLQKRGLRVFQSQYYSDPESEDSREIDIVAFKQKEINDVLIRVSLVIECKLSIEKPWLLFTSNTTGPAKPARVAQRAANILGRHYLIAICQQDKIQGLPIWELPERAAYGVTQGFTTGKDVCYSAVTSVSKAALSIATEVDEKRKREKKAVKILRRSKRICSIALPIVVVEGQLFEVFLNDRSNIEINAIENGTLLWRNPIFGAPHTIINIVTSSGFDKFTDDAIKSIDMLLDLSEKQFSDQLKQAIRRENRNSKRVF